MSHAAWRPRVTLHLHSAAVLPPAQAGRPSPLAEGRGVGCQLTEQARLGHLGLGGRGNNSTPSVAGSELRQLRDWRCRRRPYWAAGDTGRRPLGTGGGGRGAGKVGVGGESSNCARGRVSSRRGCRAGDNFSGARAAGRAGGRGASGERGRSRPRVLRLRSINSRLQLLLGVHKLPSERRKVRLKVSAAAAAPHSASGREPKEMVLPGKRYAVFYENSDQGC
ncbi:PREDICTED: uncharacterized protein LOC101382546 [Odobenus rosmarus divergens]|uniref:Uncharacterized protein LOC101382546 n=1 Tax=Odobenus rosmarus divergens TaxID=9708 RepID=A0A9B0GXY4_ODORO